MNARTVKTILVMAQKMGLSSIKFSEGQDMLEAVFVPPPAAGAVPIPIRSASESGMLREQRERLREESDERRRLAAYRHSGQVPIVKEKG